MSAAVDLAMLADVETRANDRCCEHGVILRSRAGLAYCTYTLRLFVGRHGRLPDLGPWTMEPRS